MTDVEFIKAKLQNLQKILETRADMYIGNDNWNKATNLLSFATACSGALELLKEQEPIEPEVFMDGIVKRYKCRRCGRHLINTRFWKDNYCSKCGSEVLWND